VSHIVIHDDRDGVTQYRRLDDLQASVDHLEMLHNADGIEGPRLFTLHEVEFEVKSYMKVEIGSSEPEPGLSDTPGLSDAPATPIDAPDAELLPPAQDVEYVEEAMAPIETMETTSIPDYAATVAESVGTASQSDVRRGLFGR